MTREFVAVPVQPSFCGRIKDSDEEVHEKKRLRMYLAGDLSENCQIWRIDSASAWALGLGRPKKPATQKQHFRFR